MINLSQLDVSSPASYLVAVFVPALDAILPVLPSETAVIALGVATAGSWDPRIAVLVTLVTLTCGLVRYERRSYVVATACAAVIWASYAFFIGRLGGQAFEHRPWIGLLLAFGAAVAISVLVEVLRRTRPWRTSTRTLI